VKRLLVEIAPGRPVGSGDAASSGRGRIEGAVTVGKGANHPGLSPALTSNPIERGVGPDPPPAFFGKPVFFGKFVVAQRVFDRSVNPTKRLEKPLALAAWW
jgi:hypothetical protein